MAQTVKRVVIHPKFYFAVGGRLQKLDVGTELTLSVEEAERLKKKVVDPSKTKRLMEGALVEKSGSSSDNKLMEELATAREETKKLENENAALKKRIK